jgi:hypothetical protein
MPCVAAVLVSIKLAYPSIEGFSNSVEHGRITNKFNNFFHLIPLFNHWLKSV